MTDVKKPTEKRVVLPVDPTRRTEIDKQRVPMSARPYRLLAMVKQDAVVRVQKEPDDTVMTWPHLLSIEFLARRDESIFLLLMGLFINAPLEELANGNVTPGGGQGALVLPRPPGAAGLLPPGGLGRARAPRSSSSARRSSRTSTATSRRNRPSRAQDGGRALLPVCILGLFVTFVGVFFRGPGYAFVTPFLPVRRPLQPALPSDDRVRS